MEQANALSAEANSNDQNGEAETKRSQTTFGLSRRQFLIDSAIFAAVASLPATVMAATHDPEMK